MAAAVAVETPSYVFDDRHIRWYKLREFGEHFAPFGEHFVLTVLDVDVSQSSSILCSNSRPTSGSFCIATWR